MSSSRKKARLQTEATLVMASSADAEASNMEIDEDLPPEWKPFLENVDFDATIVHDIVKAHDSLQDTRHREGLRQWSLEEWKVVLWTSLCRRYPGFTMEHAEKDLEILNQIRRSPLTSQSVIEVPTLRMVWKQFLCTI